MSDPQRDGPLAAEAPIVAVGRVEWRTLFLILGCYGSWAAVLFAAGLLPPVVAVPILAVLITLHASLCHEALHGHPFRLRVLNEALMFLPLNLAIPYGRFRDTHLAHHRDERLTDPAVSREQHAPGAGGDRATAGAGPLYGAGVAPDPQWR
jgi:fatty acid desaturase